MILLYTYLLLGLLTFFVILYIGLKSGVGAEDKLAVRIFTWLASCFACAILWPIFLIVMYYISYCIKRSIRKAKSTDNGSF